MSQISQYQIKHIIPNHTVIYKYKQSVIHMSEETRVKYMLAASLCLGLLLILYGHYVIDQLDSNVSYTDIDYRVLDEASDYVRKGHSPFLRHTYRYSPLLSYLLLVNHYSGIPYLAKGVFVVADAMVGYVLWLLIK